MRQTVLIAVASILLASCAAFGNLTTGAMTTTNRAVGDPPAGPHG